jgi:hypothetical protein
MKKYFRFGKSNGWLTSRVSVAFTEYQETWMKRGMENKMKKECCSRISRSTGDLIFTVT